MTQEIVLVEKDGTLFKGKFQPQSTFLFSNSPNLFLQLLSAHKYKINTKVEILLESA